MMAVPFWLLGALCIGLTVLPLVPFRHWSVRIWDFPRQQIVILGTAALIGLLALRGLGGPIERGFILALCAALAYQLRWILPYTRLWPAQAILAEEPPGPRTFRLVVVNVLMDNRRDERLVAAIDRFDPDLVLGVETDDWWAARLASMLPGHRHHVLHPLDNTYGMVLFSRLELVGPEVRFLLKDDIPSIRTDVRLASGDLVRLYCLHPEPPSPTEAPTSLPRDAELVLIGREIAERPGVVIVAGDLNDVAWSRTSLLFRRLSGLIDPRIGRGFINTFDARRPLVRWPLDHVFYGPELVLRRLCRLPAFGSDHFPIFIELDYRPSEAAEQPPDLLEDDDRAEARETMAEARIGAT